MIAHHHPDGQVLSCPCGARLFDPKPYAPDVTDGFVPRERTQRCMTGAAAQAGKPNRIRSAPPNQQQQKRGTRCNYQ